MDAISSHDVELVDDYLKAGADPNHNIEEQYRDYNVGIEHQPTTPLKMVVFCISDALLEDPAWDEFLQITKLLLTAGADPKPAIALSESRYGTYHPKNAEDTFGEILREIHSF